jgi:hypothetical protein
VGFVAVVAVLAEEGRRGMHKTNVYQTFQARADRIRDEFRSFLEAQKASGQKVAAYGAAAKGNTLLNYAKIKSDLLPFVCDAAKAKQGKLMPGSHIPIVPASVLQDQRPDCLVILPWNIVEEIKKQNFLLAKQGTRFATAVPNLKFS